MDFRKIFKPEVRYSIMRALSFLPDKLYLRIFYWFTTKKRINFKDPTAFSEKQKWLKVNDRRWEYSKLVDKLAVREHINEMLGTNPFSAVIPVPNGEPIIIDFATSVVAKSKFKEYQSKGLKLPDGWALDENGKPTNDPEQAMKGFVLPMAGFKGYGISMLIDLIAGLLSGSACLNNVGRFYSNDNSSMNVGFYITIIDPKQVFNEDYDIAIKEYVDTLRNSKSADGQTIVLPGDDRVKYKNSLKG